MRTRCRWNPFTEQLPSDSPGNVDVMAGRYQATALVPLFAARSLHSSGHTGSVAHTESDVSKEYIANAQ
jgi:hypothetical protein